MCSHHIGIQMLHMKQLELECSLHLVTPAVNLYIV